MFRMLVPVDGSETSDRAVDHLRKKLSWYKNSFEIHLLNVQHPLHGDVATFIDQAQIEKFHHDEGLKALASARAKLDAEKIPYIFHVGVGDPAHVIVHYAKEKKCEQIFMGTRGLGSVMGMIMGSVTFKVIHLSEVPILLVK
jgi:nucleotide-binding universal stress UspA family protein